MTWLIRRLAFGIVLVRASKFPLLLLVALALALVYGGS